MYNIILFATRKLEAAFNINWVHCRLTLTVGGRALVAGQAGAGEVGPLGLARREGAAWVGLAGVLQLAVHRAVPVLHLLVPLLTPAPGLVISHLA